MCGHVCVEVHVDMHLSVLFITWPCVVLTFAMDRAKFVEIIARFKMTCSYLSIWSIKLIGFVIIAYEVTVCRLSAVGI